MEEPNEWCYLSTLYDEGKRSKGFLTLKNETVCVISHGFFLVSLIRQTNTWYRVLSGDGVQPTSFP